MWTIAQKLFLSPGIIFLKFQGIMSKVLFVFMKIFALEILMIRCNSNEF